MMETESTQAPLTLSEGQSAPQQLEAVPTSQGSPLNETEVQAILDRLPTLPAAADQQEPFKLAGDPIPPPKTGETVPQAFPPESEAGSSPEVESGPLKVLRYSPEGEIPVAPFISITFNQPMVPLTTLEQLSELEVPVQVEPDISGTWRWLGTKTLTFQSDAVLYDQLPKATAYTVTIPAGTQSMSGGKLAESLTFQFSTPPLQLAHYYPTDEQQPADAWIFLQFNQRINAEILLPFISLNAGGTNYPVMLVSESELKTNKTIEKLTEDALTGRWLVIKANKPLPLDTQFTVKVRSGAPSAEGPLLSSEDLSFNFSTYAPLKIEEYGCSWSDEPCQPLSPFYIRFNNPLDITAFEEELLTISPALPGVNANIYGNTISIEGASSAQTTYTITVNKEVKDQFGQTLARNQQLKIRVGKATPTLVGPDQNFVTLDPAVATPSLSVYTINYSKLDVEIYAVQPSDWPLFMTYLREYRRTDNPPEIPGTRVFNSSVAVQGSSDALNQVDINLQPYMDGSSAQFIVVVRPPRQLFNKDNQWQTIQTWVQITQIGLDAFLDHSEMVAWTTSLAEGAPLKDVSIEAGSSGLKTTTNEDGLARFAIPLGTNYLVARLGSDTAILPRSAYPYDDAAWQTRNVQDELRWTIFDDRSLYRPGEEIHVKGWLRRIGGKQNGDVSLVGSALSQISYTIRDSQGNQIFTDLAAVNALGGFDFSVTLPEAVNLGSASIELKAMGNLSDLTGLDAYHTFQIQEFRRPEFEVIARTESSGPYLVGEQAVVAVDANYYAGGALPDAEVTWQVSLTPSIYSPPNWPDFTFGSWTPWWISTFYEPVSPDVSQTFTGRTNAGGTHYLNLDFSPTLHLRPQSVKAEATVMDVNRQAWTNATHLLVHPASLYIGLQTERYFVQQGQPLKVNFIVTDLDGNPVIDRVVEIEAARMEWKNSPSGWHEQAVDVQICKTGSTKEPGECTFETPEGGKYQITALITDEMGRKNQTQITRWVSGGKRPPARKVELEEVTLIPDRDNYQPGDTAQILVQSPFGAATGLLTVSRSGLLYTQSFEIKEDTITLSIPIEEQHIPNLNIQVDLVGSAPRTDDHGSILEKLEPRPAYASAKLILPIPPLKRALTVQATAERQELEPGEKTNIEISLVDASGEPVPNAEVALIVVDEAILALSGAQIDNPLDFFYSTRYADISSLYSRSSIILVDPLSLAAANQQRAVEKSLMDDLGLMPMAAPSATMGMEESMMESPAMEADTSAGTDSSPISIRSDFNPLANFSPAVRTDARGKAVVSIQMPDNLTRYRVTAVAVDSSGGRFGITESNMTARLPLMVRPSAPRFLNFGDQFELPVVLQNQTDQDMTVNVALQTVNISLTDYQGLQVNVPARNRIEVRFPAKAEMAGTGSFQVAAVAGKYSDAALVHLPIYTPATTEAFATYGVVDSGSIFQPLAKPQDVFPQYGGLEISTSSTALQALTDAVLYLSSYPYDCSEQIASRVLGIAALRDVLSAFEAEGLPSPEELETAVQKDIERLEGMQNYDGGFPTWQRGKDSIPFNTIHVAHALQRAEMKGFIVPENMQQSLQNYLVSIESYYPSWYGEETRRTLSAYALYVRALMGDVDNFKAEQLIDQNGLESFNLSAVGWLWQVLSQADANPETLNEIRTLVANRVVETPSAANFTTAYHEQSYLLLDSDRRTDAILLDSMILDQPDSDLIPKLVNGLLAHRKEGKWGNTQENVFVLLALDHYFNTYETQTPDFVARIWLGETYAGSHLFSGRSTDVKETTIPMSYLVSGPDMQNLIINKEGSGRLYYRMGLRYAPTDLQMKPLDMGFVVERIYEAVDNPKDVYRDSDGIWHIKAGAQVRVQLSLTADNRRYHVALADPLPAGLEIINPELAVSSSSALTAPETSNRYWWWGPWYEHQNMRDERAEAFTSLLWEGTYQYSYLARATTPGRFVVPPVKAEEMYTPEVFGRSASDIVIVE
jgi:uncharacterized protein YfaS (alpha-2-macroglobulin family)